MSEKWDSNSTIEEKNTFYITPQLSQFVTRYSMSNFDQVLKKLYNKQSIDEADFKVIIYFLDSDWKDRYKERYEALVQYASPELKRKYTEYRLKQIKMNNVNDDLINSLFNGNPTDGQAITIYYLVGEHHFVLEDELIDEKVKQTIRNVLTDDFVKEMQNNSINRPKRNALSGTELMNKEFKERILSSIPSGYTLLEQGIYLYIKLCQMLSYDSTYYVDRESVLQAHEDFASLGKINEQNPEAICYQFVTLYSELLEEIGVKVNVTTRFSLSLGEDGNPQYSGFDDAHAKMDFVIDNIFVSADSTTSVLGGDLINAKLGKELNGLKCLNVNEEERQVFDNSLAKVYGSLKSNNEFVQYDAQIKELPLTERLKTLFDNIIKMDVQSVDFVSYITQLKHKFFTPDELQWNIAISFVGKDDGINKYPVAVFSVNTNDIINVQQDSVHYLYDAKTHELIKYSNQELQELFDTGLFYLEESRSIPGIVRNKKAVTKM